MEKPPRPNNKTEDDEYQPLDRVAGRGHAKEGDWPGADLYDQVGDLTNTTESGDNEQVLKTNGVHRQKDVPSEYAGGNLHVATEAEMNGDEEEDEAARWLREHDRPEDKAA